MEPVEESWQSIIIYNIINHEDARPNPAMPLPLKLLLKLLPMPTNMQALRQLVDLRLMATF